MRSARLARKLGGSLKFMEGHGLQSESSIVCSIMRNRFSWQSSDSTFKFELFETALPHLHVRTCQNHNLEIPLFSPSGIVYIWQCICVNIVALCFFMHLFVHFPVYAYLGGLLLLGFGISVLADPPKLSSMQSRVGQHGMLRLLGFRQALTHALPHAIGETDLLCRFCIVDLLRPHGILCPRASGTFHQAVQVCRRTNNHAVIGIAEHVNEGLLSAATLRPQSNTQPATSESPSH